MDHAIDDASGALPDSLCPEKDLIRSLLEVSESGDIQNENPNTAQTIDAGKGLHQYLTSSFDGDVNSLKKRKVSCDHILAQLEQ